MKTRSCNGCTKCCEGWLSANIKGHDMYPGKPCYFVEIGIGCKEYEDRPKDPCISYNCMWVSNIDVPEEFSPINTGVIIDIQNRENNISFVCLTPAPNNPSIEMLSWAVVYAVSNQLNIAWWLDNKVYWFGDNIFSNYMNLKYGVNNV